MEQNKTRTYVFYAFGEILLVVAGILIALQINNWNEERVNRNNEEFYLQKIEFALRSDSLQLETIMGVGESLMVQLDSAAIMLKEPGAYPADRFHQNITALFYVNEFTPNRSVFDNLNATGEIKNLQDQAFVDGLYSYYNQNTDLGVKEYARSIFTPYLLKFDEINFQGYNTFVPSKLDWLAEANNSSRPIQVYADDPFFINAVRVKRFQLQLQNERFMNLLVFAKESLQRPSIP